MQILLVGDDGKEYSIRSSQGQALHVPIYTEQQYQLVEVASGVGPENIVTGRVGNDLHVAFAGESLLYASLILENFYLYPNSTLVGMGSNGILYAYSPESGEAEDSIHLLAEQMAAAQTLGGSTTDSVVYSTAGAEVSPATMLASLAGLGVVGGILAGSRSKRSAEVQHPQPQTPFDPDQPAPPPPSSDDPLVPPPLVPDPPPAPGPNPPISPPTFPPANRPGSVKITGEAKVGAILTAEVTDADGVPSNITYRWFAGSQEIGQGKIYTVRPSDAGKQIHVQASYTDNAKHQESPSSDSTAPIADTTPPPNRPGSVKITGEAKVGATLTAEVSDADGVPSNITYRWFAGSQEIGQGKTYTVRPADAGKQIHVQASYTDNAKHSESPSSESTAAVAEAGPNHPGSVKIIGEAKVGVTLTAEVTDTDGLPSNITYRWFAGGQEIGQGKTYRIQKADLSKIISVEASYQDNAGYSEKISAQTSEVGYGIYQHAKYGKYIDASEFGVDLSGQSDSSAAIKLALDTAHKEGVALYLGEGTLKISEQIKLNADNDKVTALFGEGMGKTKIIFDWQQTGVHNPNTNLTDSRDFAGIRIDGVNGKIVGDLSLEYRHQKSSDFYREGESYFGRVNGIIVNDASRTKIDSVEVTGANRAGVHFTSQRTLDEGLRDKLIRGEIGEHQVPVGEGNQVINSHMHGNRVAGILIAYQKDFLAEGNRLAHNGHEKDGGTGYGIASLAGSYNFGITYRGNHTDHNYRKGLDIHDGNRILIENNTSSGDRLNGIAVYNRQFAMNDVTIRGNTIEADPAFRLAVDDGDKGTTKVVRYHGYTAIQIQTNEKFLDLRTPGPGKFDISGNTIKNLAVYQNEQQTYGIEFRNHERAIDYLLNIENNRISGESSKYLIAILNDTQNRATGEAGPGSGTIRILGNTADIANIVQGGVPFYIEEKNQNGKLRGRVEIENNTITIREKSDGTVEFMQMLGNAEHYSVNRNTLTAKGKIDKELISFYGLTEGEHPVLEVRDNILSTELEILHGRWLELGQKHNADGSIYAEGNTHNGAILNYILIPAGESGKAVFITPNINPADFAKLIALDSSQKILDYLGEHGSKAFAHNSEPNVRKFHGTPGDDILVAGSGADEIIGREGADIFVFIGSGKGSSLSKLLDFNSGEDMIRIVAGQGERIENLRFDVASKTLHYDVQGQDVSYSDSFSIRAHDNHTLSAEEVLNAVRIL